MTATPSDKARVAKVASAFDRLGLEACQSVDELTQRNDKAGYLLETPIRLAGCHDISPALTLYDPRLGTLGFVECISAATADPEGQAWGAIERATAVRQILLEDALRRQRAARPGTPRILPLQVELVLLVAGAATPIRRSLTQVARETGYLRLIGLGVLEVPDEGDIGADALRRAFSWLLIGTRAWFESSAFPNTQNAALRARPGFELELDNYRTAGKRHFSCRSGAWLTLVHGHNGSGKSTLAEALELSLTGRIQRIDDAGQADYFRVVRHQRAGTTAAELAALSGCKVALSRDGVLHASVQLSANAEPLHLPAAASGVHASSFRLDQAFMDKLVRTNAAGRAAIFLSAFAPDDRAAIASLQQARADVRKAWEALPLHVRERAARQMGTLSTGAAGSGAAALGADPGDKASNLSASSVPTPNESAILDYAARELGPLDAASTRPLTSAALEALLPVDAKALQAMSALHPPIGDALGALLELLQPPVASPPGTSADGVSTLIASLQSGLTSLSSALPMHMANLSTALGVFQEFRSWDAASVPEPRASGDFEQALNRWLELRALADLTVRYAGIERSVAAARRAGWPADEEGAALAALVPTQFSTELVARCERLEKAVSGARDEVAASTRPADNARSQAAPSARRWLSPAEIEALNHVGPLLPSTRDSEAFGLRVSRALADSSQVTLAEGVLGKSGGLDVAIEQASDLLRVCESYHKVSVADSFSGISPLQRARTLLEAANVLRQRNRELEASFFLRLAQGDRRELGQLLAAFNELLALLTPARWEYRDVQLHPDLEGGAPVLTFQTSDGAAADLLFNTAGLNAAALTLFLLLAPRVPSELRLLVLDDPLQNMDELTVTTVGRTLAKLRSIYPPGWALLTFLHGAENVQRIADEAPCDVCELPWLQSVEDERIEAKTRDDELRWQPLTRDLFRARPASASAAAAE
jgi:energy-coupling factor transporter ATP-binding protein EcfA2